LLSISCSGFVVDPISGIGANQDKHW